jgi:hypothetical protein
MLKSVDDRFGIGDKLLLTPPDQETVLHDELSVAQKVTWIDRIARRRRASVKGWAPSGSTGSPGNPPS